jgi:hypothetical protein
VNGKDDDFCSPSLPQLCTFIRISHLISPLQRNHLQLLWKLFLIELFYMYILACVLCMYPVNSAVSDLFDLELFVLPHSSATRPLLVSASSAPRPRPVRTLVLPSGPVRTQLLVLSSLVPLLLSRVSVLRYLQDDATPFPRPYDIIL